MKDTVWKNEKQNFRRNIPNFAHVREPRPLNIENISLHFLTNWNIQHTF